MDVLCGEVDPQYSRLPYWGNGMNVGAVGMDMGCPTRHKALGDECCNNNAVKVLFCSSFGTLVYQVDGAQCMSHGF